jgi:uncharacterized membrane protein YtjA (UPF0391 family)
VRERRPAIRSRFCSVRYRHFERFPARKPRGTSVPDADYFGSRCAIVTAALIFETGRINRGRAMLSWVVTFLVVALIAGILGFGGVAGVSIEIAKTIFFIAVVLFLISAVVGLARGRTRV